MVGFDPSSVQLTKTEYGFSSASSGVLTRCVCQPFDVVKIRFQLQLEPIKKGSLAKYTSISGAFQKIPREEGFRALWKGLIPAQLLSVVFNTSQFVAFEMITKNVFPLLPLTMQCTDLKPFTHFICGGLAGCTATIIAQPCDVMRTRFVAQGEPKRYTSITQGFALMIREEGARAMYKGLVPTLIQIGPQTGCQFGFYAILTSVWGITFQKVIFTIRRTMFRNYITN
jgi:solute carrier family 25 thiamine pyrophosphate transporter 19